MDEAATAVSEVIEAALREAHLDFQQVGSNMFGVQLPGERRLRTTCWLTVGDHALTIEAFVVRRPDENREGVHAWLLKRNPRMYVVSWSIDDTGDIYLTGRLPLVAVSADELDRVLGSVLEYADGSFNYLLRLGFGSAIRREWAWRLKNGESLANLAAFSDFAQQPAGT
jgi:Putative bacterial sensory transduction regulator